jgi:hypothetical protein
MTQAGGPAALNGFLYQILQHLGWIASLKLSGAIHEHSADGDCALTLEPVGGGDARARIGNAYIVEQYKSRSTGTWSINAIIDGVLADLRLAVAIPSNPNSHYRFVTDGRPGRITEFLRFLKTVRSAVSPDDLDDCTTYAFGTDLAVTDHGLFRHIVAATRRPSVSVSNNEDENVFQLLRGFEMKYEAKSSTVVPKIEALLRIYAPDLGDEASLRKLLVAELFERLSHGELVLDEGGIDALLRKVGLNPDRVRNFARLAETTAGAANRMLSRFMYEAGADVRPPPVWPNDKSVLMIAGDSGNGKTWQLYRLVASLAEQRQIVSLQPAGSDVNIMLKRASNDIWQTGLGETNEKTLYALVQHFHQIRPNAAMPLLTIAIDDVQEVRMARELIRQDWGQLGIRLAFTVPSAVARHLEVEADTALHIHWSERFSIEELDALLRQKGRSWAELPTDLKNILRTPILAGIYGKLPYGSIRTAPQSEYEIFDQFWEAMASRSGPGDAGILLAVAERVLSKKEYPLSRGSWGEVGLFDEKPLVRLTTAGWLQHTVEGDIAFSHDRLLNWAVAKALFRSIVNGQVALELISEQIIYFSDPHTHFLRRLDYVPMDLVWLLAGASIGGKVSEQLMQALEASQNFGSSGEGLYTDLIPTLGQRAIPILLNRLDVIAVIGPNDLRLKWIAQGLSAVARMEAVDFDDVPRTLLDSQSDAHQMVALNLLAIVPSLHVLDRLWHLHAGRFKALHEGMGGGAVIDYQVSAKALRECSRLDPQWLHGRIAKCASEEGPVSELGYLLLGSDLAAGAAIWSALSDTLMVTTPVNKPRSILHCIGRFRDRSKVDFVVRQLGKPDDNGDGAALMALVLLDPDMALNHLSDVSDSTRAMNRTSWLPLLLYLRPPETQKKILEICRSDPKGSRYLEMLFDGDINDLSMELFHFYLADVKMRLQGYIDAALIGNDGWLFRTLRFIGDVARPDFLNILANEAGTDMEAMICQVATGRIGVNARTHDHILEGARRVLINIGGEGITTLVNNELAASDSWARQRGLKWSTLRPDATTLNLVAAIARHPVSKPSMGQGISEDMQEHYHATVALATLNADAALVEGILSSGALFESNELVALRDMSRPMDKELTRKAFEVICAAKLTAEDKIIPALTIAWLSADPDMIPPVERLLEQAPPDGKIAGFACIALHQLGDRSPKFALLASKLIATRENSVWGINAMLAAGDAGFDALAKRLRAKPLSTWQDADRQLVEILHTHASTRAFAIEAATNICLNNNSFFSRSMHEIAAEADNKSIRDKIYEDAFKNSINTSIPLGAVEGLAKFDPARALAAAENSLHQQPASERAMCALMARVAPDVAVNKLIKAALMIDRDSLRPAVGRSLRRLNPETVDALLIEQMQSTCPETRTKAIELAGWLGPGRLADALEKIVKNDAEVAVILAGLAALARQRSEHQVLELFHAFRDGASNRQWPILLAIVDSADPHLLSDNDDQLWLGSILSDVPYSFAYGIKDMLSDRRRK